LIASVLVTLAPASAALAAPEPPRRVKLRATREARPPRLRLVSPRLGARPVDAVIAREAARVLRAGKLTRGKLGELLELATDSTGDSTPAVSTLRRLVTRHPRRFASPAALAAARAQLERGGAPVPASYPDNALFSIRGSATDASTRGQELTIKGEGTLELATGRRTYSRGWLQVNQSPLARAHGSPVPSSPTLPEAERRALDALTPGERLDRAVQTLTGKSKIGMTSFRELALGSSFSQPNQPDWGGFCYSWSHVALDRRLSRLVDVRGPEGKRGLWIAGQWLSRADLGNWLTAVASVHAQGEGQVLWYNPEPEDLVKGLLLHTGKGGRGVRVDIGPALKNPSEVWFQPFTSSRVSVRGLPAAARDGVLAVAAQPVERAYGTRVPGVAGSDVKLIQVRGRYGDEKGDGHEGPPAMTTMTWNVYAVLDGQRRAVRYLLASDPRLAAIRGLPTRESAAVPRDLFVPDHGFIDNILLGRPDPSLEGSLYGPHLKFLVGTVLARGVPGSVRDAFEAELSRARPGRLDPLRIRRLELRFPTVANAYTPDQWRALFARRGLRATRFGAPGKENP
jgi:hypothetical protein